MNIKKVKINSGMLENIGRFIKQNGSTLSMLGSFVCLGASLYAAFKASDDVTKIHDKYEADVSEMRAQGLETPEKAKELKVTRNIHYILAYKWVILLGLGAGGLTFLTHWLDGLAIGGLTTALALEKDRVQKFIKNGKETFGEVPWREFEDKTFEQIMSEKFFGEDEAKCKKLLEENGDMLVADIEEEEIFQINYDDLKAVLDKAEQYTATHTMSKAEFYTKFLGLPYNENPAKGSTSVKYWGPGNQFKAHVGKINMYGCTMPTLMYDNPSTVAYKAGVPGAKKPA